MVTLAAPETYQSLSTKFSRLSPNNSVDELDSFGAQVRQAILQSEKKTIEYYNLVHLQDNVWDLLFQRIENQNRERN